MVDTNLTYLFPVLDRSGSMSRYVEQTCSGFDAFIAAQLEQPGACKVTLAQFHTQYEIVYADRDIREVPRLALYPRGGTALLDAIAYTIIAAGRQLSLMPERKRPGSVIVPILTDGEENSSREYSYPMVARMIEEQTSKYSWLFTYIGANQDAIKVGSELGIGYNHSLTFNQHNTKAVFDTLAANTNIYRGARAAGQSYAASAAAASYTDAQRSEAIDESESR